jgi:hypothetical protein
MSYLSSYDQPGNQDIFLVSVEIHSSSITNDIPIFTHNRPQVSARTAHHRLLLILLSWLQLETWLPARRHLAGYPEP